MRVGIVTHYAASNCGAMLQVYALQEAIKRLCPHVQQVECVDFSHAWRTRELSLKTFFHEELSRNPLGRLWHLLLFLKLWPQRHQVPCQRFLTEYMQLSPPAGIDAERRLDLKSVCYDVLLSGSDQVFAGGHPYYYLRCASPQEGLRRVAYAPSFGKLSALTPEMRERIRPWLDDFDYLTCREDEGAALIRELTGRDCPHVLDPTFLLEPRDYSAIERKPEGAPEGDFVYVYALWKDPAMMRTAREFSKRHGLRLYCSQAYHGNALLSFMNRTRPDELLWLIRHARHVFTHSFHGIALSLNLGTPFHAVRSTAPQSRIAGLLSLCKGAYPGGNMTNYCSAD